MPIFYSLPVLTRPELGCTCSDLQVSVSWQPLHRWKTLRSFPTLRITPSANQATVLGRIAVGWCREKYTVETHLPLIAQRLI